MNLIHRHIFTSVLLTCAISVILFGFVLMVGNALKDLLGPMLAGQLGIDTSLRLIGLLIPFVFYYALPMGMLTGILLVLGRMSSDREITALRSAGLSVAWLSAPIIFLALLGVGASLLVNFQFMPVARLAYQREFAEAVRQNPLSFIVPKTFIREFPGRVVYVDNIRGGKFEGIWVWDLDKQSRVRGVFQAKYGELVYSEKENALELTGHEVTIEYRDAKDPENFQGEFRGLARSEIVPFKLPLDQISGDRVIKKKLKWYTFPQLMAEWTKLRHSAPDVSREEHEKELMRVQITIQEKFATAFSVLSFALVAVPLGIKVSRKETSANLGLGLLLVMGYYIASVLAGMFDNHPALRPDLIVWIPNLAFQGLGLWLFYKIDRS